MKHFNQLDDAQLLEAALAEFQRVTELPVVFGGYEVTGVATVTTLAGNRTDKLQGLRVEQGRGLGGKAMAECRPRFTADYEHSQHITHDYDREVTGEGIRSLVAIPVIVDDCVRAVLYGGAYERTTLTSIVQKPVADIAASLSRELRVRDEIARRIAETGPITTMPQRNLPASQLEELRESYAEIRSLMSTVTNPEMRARLESVEEKLARLSGATPASQPSGVALSPREIDVLAQVALGVTNAEVGEALGLTVGTVKSYLHSASAKLQCTSRHATVSAARREGLIP